MKNGQLLKANQSNPGKSVTDTQGSNDGFKAIKFKNSTKELGIIQKAKILTDKTPNSDQTAPQTFQQRVLAAQNKLTQLLTSGISPSEQKLEQALRRVQA